jgi:hypothetical protein
MVATGIITAACSGTGESVTRGRSADTTFGMTTPLANGAVVPRTTARVHLPIDVTKSYMNGQVGEGMDTFVCWIGGLWGKTEGSWPLAPWPEGGFLQTDQQMTLGVVRVDTAPSSSGGDRFERQTTDENGIPTGWKVAQFYVIGLEENDAGITTLGCSFTTDKANANAIPDTITLQDVSSAFNSDEHGQHLVIDIGAAETPAAPPDDGDDGS